MAIIDFGIDRAGSDMEESEMSTGRIIVAKLSSWMDSVMKDRIKQRGQECISNEW